jgi:hypothetical protein
MKIKLILSTLCLTLFCMTTVSAQEPPTVVRAWLCSVVPGHSMDEVVAVARDIEWDEESSPSATFFREALAVPGEFQRDWDFVWADFYADWGAYVDSRSAQRDRPSGRTASLGLFDMISCDERRSVSNVSQANQGDIFSDTETTPMGSQFCDLNGATVQDAVTMATATGQRLGAYSAVDMQAFGGQGGYEAFSRVYVRYVFADGQTFADSLDALSETPPPPNGSNGISCGTGGLWLSHRIYQNN